MKKTNDYLKNTTHKQCSIGCKVTIMAVFVSLLCACQLTQPQDNLANQAIEEKQDSQYSQYYLHLKSLEKTEVLSEEKKQKALYTAANSEDPDSKGKLILIYSLPNTPLHNPYKAKRLLNEHLLANTPINQHNLAFILLLKDQLNIQLNMLAQQQKTHKAFEQQQSENSNNIEMLQQQLEQINNQLMLLKQIDQKINERS